ncbi:tetratricopeptide repeat protein [Robiginitalea sp. IMCC44478]|uniref:tetratricopeptide repeat protein n=1 Tax=Robiginitalea sp. IMCC44478 TaxID=3459122 RepID=UPI0040421C1B
MKYSLGYHLLIWLLFLSWGTQAQDTALFEKATEAYNEGKYSVAIDYYNEILDNGKHSAAVYFNLGNAYYKQDEIAPSIYYYEKALLLAPNDPEILNNLGFARNMTIDAIEPLPESEISRYYKKIVNWLSIDQWAYTGIVFMLLFVLGSILFYFLRYPNQKRLALLGGLSALFLCLVTTGLSYLQYSAYKKDQPAIIFDEEVAVSTEPNERSPDAFTLHEGTKVQVLDSLENWRKIRIIDGQTGWLSAGSIRLLKDF